MNRVLKIVLGIEIAVGLLWTVLATMTHGAGGLAVVGLFLYVYALLTAFFLFAAWVYWTRPEKPKNGELDNGIADPVLVLADGHPLGERRCLDGAAIRTHKFFPARSGIGDLLDRTAQGGCRVSSIPGTQPRIQLAAIYLRWRRFFRRIDLGVAEVSRRN